MADLPGWQWSPGQWAREPDGCTVLVDSVDEHGRPMASGVALADVVPDGDGVGMGEWALRQIRHGDVVLDVDNWTVWLTPMAYCRAPTLYAACEAVARARGGWGR